MIDLSKYDINKIKSVDIIFLKMAEDMNKRDWWWEKPLWDKLLSIFYNKPMPKKYYMHNCKIR